MLVVRYKMTCRPDQTDAVVGAMADVVHAARALPGVLHFDVARDVTDPHALIATEVFEDRAAMAREEAIPEVAAVIGLMQSGALTRPPEATIYEVASAESPSM